MAKTRIARRPEILKANSKKRVYYFGRSRVEGTREMRDLLGAKGANLAEMASIGLSVPPGFTITTEACAEFYAHNGTLPAGLMDEVRGYLPALEAETRRKFAGTTAPMLVSVRSGAAVPMPGIMDTVLNIGVNDDVAEALAVATGNARFAFDAYRRLIDMFGVVVMGVSHGVFEDRLRALLCQHEAADETGLDEEAMRQLVADYKGIYRDATGEKFPQDPFEQLERAIAAVFRSWRSPRALRYRSVHEITGLLGTAVNIQLMVFGNMGEDSGTGIAFTRDPSTGRNELFGEFLIDAQGEDVMAGIRPPVPVGEMRKWRADMHQQLLKTKERLERHYRDMQQFEFTIERGTYYLLQTLPGKRTGSAAVKIACDMVREKLIERGQALLRVPPNDLHQLLMPSFAGGSERDVLAVGLGASPGAAVGRPAFSAFEAIERSRAGEKVILVCRETSADDMDGLNVSEAILTTTGGMTSHAAIAARVMGKPCVTGAAQLRLDPEAHVFQADGRTLTHEDLISLDGASGQVMAGALATAEPVLSADFARLMRWADECRRLRVRANADTPEEARLARQLGAEGIGLIKTENMWLEDERIIMMRQMILAQTPGERQEALDLILPHQREDFVEIFTAMEGLPVTVRLLDPPLHQFLPHDRRSQIELARRIGVTVESLRARIADLEENNPMLGHRGCRLCVTYPEILEMQIRAIVEAAIECRRNRVVALPEIMHPLIGADRELRMLRAMTQKTIEQVKQERKFTARLDIPIGCMIEVPRAAVTADRIAEYADFFSFGTNDLTQMTFGFSREDVVAFLPAYLRNEVLDKDPFQCLDVEGVGRLMQMAIVRGRSNRPGLKCGLCGPHGGDPASIAFCHEIGLDYVSARPLRVPVARLAAAQAALRAR